MTQSDIAKRVPNNLPLLTRSHLIPALLFGLFIFVLRWPLLVSDASYLDGDEALTGVMVLHVLQGMEFPLFTYGAKFGLAAIEILASAGVAGLFGLSPFTLQISVLLIFSLGALALTAAAYEIAGRRAMFVTGGLIASTPAWMHVSIAAWQYNHAAFAACCVTLWIIARLLNPLRTNHLGYWFTLGIGGSLAFFTQPIYAIALGPAVLSVIWQRAKIRHVIVMSIPVCGCVLVYAALRGSDPQYWSPSILTMASLETVLALPVRFWIMMSGTYFLGSWTSAGPVTNALATILYLLGICAAFSAVLDAWRTKQWSYSMSCLAGAAVVFVFSTFIDPRYFGFRHLLPAIAFLSLLIALEINRFGSTSFKRWSLFALLGIIIAGTTYSTYQEVAALSFSGSRTNAANSERDALAELLASLRSSNVGHVYCNGPMFQWKINFASRGEVVARWKHAVDRYPPFPRAVDQALFAGKPVALVSEVSDFPAYRQALIESEFPDVQVLEVATRYAVIENPPLSLLARNFQLTDHDSDTRPMSGP